MLSIVIGNFCSMLTPPCNLQLLLHSRLVTNQILLKLESNQPLALNQSENLKVANNADFMSSINC